jgi:hypothetical protein
MGVPTATALIFKLVPAVAGWVFSVEHVKKDLQVGVAQNADRIILHQELTIIYIKYLVVASLQPRLVEVRTIPM